MIIKVKVCRVRICIANKKIHRTLNSSYRSPNIIYFIYTVPPQSLGLSQRSSSKILIKDELWLFILVFSPQINYRKFFIWPLREKKLNKEKIEKNEIIRKNSEKDYCIYWYLESLKLFEIIKNY